MLMLTFVLAQVFHFPLPTYKSPSLLLSTIVPYILPSNTLGCNKSIHQSFQLFVPTPFLLLAYSIAARQSSPSLLLESGPNPGNGKKTFNAYFFSEYRGTGCK